MILRLQINVMGNVHLHQLKDFGHFLSLQLMPCGHSRQLIRQLCHLANTYSAKTVREISLTLSSLPSRPISAKLPQGMPPHIGNLRGYGITDWALDYSTPKRPGYKCQIRHDGCWLSRLNLIKCQFPLCLADCANSERADTKAPVKETKQQRKLCSLG
jgi:hypothetical protein